MPGGLLNLASSGNQDILLTGNPQKTFWSSTYKKYTNFGLQNFRLDYEGQRQMGLSTDTTYSFKVKRYAELLMDMYFVINLPDIYSPILPPVDGTPTSKWVPYEFKWIKNLGAMMIRSVRFTIGGSLIQTFTGYDMVALANRDLSTSQKEKWDEMTGNTAEFHNPSKAYGRFNAYPNAVYTETGSAEPSIRGRQLRIPLPIFWGMNAQQAFPLVCLQYSEMQVEIVLRPIREIFQIRDILDAANNHPVVAPNFNIAEYQFYRFLQTPPNAELIYPPSQTTSWNENTHLSCTYCFLSDDEAKTFAFNQQQYLFKELHQTWFYKVPVSTKVWLQDSTGLVVSWMMMFQRSDVANRNEWSNFTNWPYDFLPFDITPLSILMTDSPVKTGYTFGVTQIDPGTLGYGLNPDGTETGLFSTGVAYPENRREVLLRMGILFDGIVREEERPAEVFLYEQQYLAIAGRGSASLKGLYCYNFCLNTSPFNLQPSGAINLSKYSKIELDFTTIEPTLALDINYNVVCDAETGNPVATTKGMFQLYDYTFNLMVIEERYNVLIFSGGNAGLMAAR
jgi:hypothetical protein